MGLHNPGYSQEEGKCWLKEKVTKFGMVSKHLDAISGALDIEQRKLRDTHLKRMDEIRNYLVPHENFISGNPPSSTVTLLNTKIMYGFAKRDHIKLIKDHIKRERYGYKILKAAILTASRNSITIDVGANHGIYTLFAAKWGSPEQFLWNRKSPCVE